MVTNAAEGRKRRMGKCLKKLTRSIIIDQRRGKRRNTGSPRLKSSIVLGRAALGPEN